MEICSYKLGRVLKLFTFFTELDKTQIDYIVAVDETMQVTGIRLIHN